MCGAYQLKKKNSRVGSEKRLKVYVPKLEQLRLVPSKNCPVIGSDVGAVDGLHEFEARWGIQGETHFHVLARAENLAQYFSNDFAERRLLIPATGFWEKKTFFEMTDGELFFMAAIYRKVLGSPVPQFAIVTVPANELVRNANPRMPAILRPKNHFAWLSSETSSTERLKMLEPWPATKMCCPGGVEQELF